VHFPKLYKVFQPFPWQPVRVNEPFLSSAMLKQSFALQWNKNVYRLFNPTVYWAAFNYIRKYWRSNCRVQSSVEFNRRFIL
jgi:hypothetical protein